MRIHHEPSPTTIPTIHRPHRLSLQTPTSHLPAIITVISRSLPYVSSGCATSRCRQSLRSRQILCDLIAEHSTEEEGKKDHDKEEDDESHNNGPNETPREGDLRHLLLFSREEIFLFSYFFLSLVLEAILHSPITPLQKGIHVCVKKFVL